jgi:hypothetical protein
MASKLPFTARSLLRCRAASCTAERPPVMASYLAIRRCVPALPEWPGRGLEVPLLAWRLPGMAGGSSPSGEAGKRRRSLLRYHRGMAAAPATA